MVAAKTLIVQQTTRKVTWAPNPRVVRKMIEINKWDHSLVSQLDEF